MRVGQDSRPINEMGSYKSKIITKTDINMPFHYFEVIYSMYWKCIDLNQYIYFTS